MNLFLYVIELFVNMFKSNTINNNKKGIQSKGEKVNWDCNKMGS